MTTEPYTIGITPKDPAFKQLVDAAIVDLFRSGHIQALYSKWFESPIPLTNINLKLPMSASLQRVIATPADSLTRTCTADQRNQSGSIPGCANACHSP